MIVRELNPNLYEAIYDWYRQLPSDVNVIELGNTRDNLKNSKEAIIACLVEQFPRSYRESYELYCDLFNNLEIFTIYDNLDCINVLALGTGSGGDVFGLIHAFEDYYCEKQINIYTVEGNVDALLSQVNMFRRYIDPNLIKNDVNLIPLSVIIHSKFYSLKQKLNQVSQKKGIKKFDLIQSFKWMNEQSAREKIGFYDLYSFINTYLLANRISVLAEYANPLSPFKCDHSVSQRALNEYYVYCQQNGVRNQLCALTPTPCVARRLTGFCQKQCKGCQGCFEEVKAYVKFADQTSYAWQSSCLFSMKLASGELGHHLVKSLQDDTIGYQTAVRVGPFPELFCTLNANVLEEKRRNAFKLSQRE